MTRFPLSLSATIRVCLVVMAATAVTGCNSPSNPSSTASATAMDGPGDAPSLGAGTKPVTGPATTASSATSSGGASVPTASTGR